jgi:hypothetical protein
LRDTGQACPKVAMEMGEEWLLGVSCRISKQSGKVSWDKRCQEDRICNIDMNAWLSYREHRKTFKPKVTQKQIQKAC